jgi:hypothetical protein
MTRQDIGTGSFPFEDVHCELFETRPPDRIDIRRQLGGIETGAADLAQALQGGWVFGGDAGYRKTMQDVME